MDYLDQYRSENPEFKADIEEIENIVSGINACKDARITVTTHAMLCNIPDEVLHTYDAVIVDEDILYLQLLSNIKSVSKTALERLSTGKSTVYAKIADTMLKAKEEEYYTLSPVCNFHPRYNTGMKRKEDYGDDFSDDDEADMDDGGNVIDLYRAGAYVLHDGIYQCLYITDLPRVKYIVLSATLNAEVYAAYFKDRKIVEYEQVLCKYTGELIQYTYHSLWRDDLAKKQCIYDFISDMTNKKDIIKISFKSEDEKHRMNSRNIHYGNAIGINDFAGKDIAVIGTPYKHPIAHLLPCCYLYGAPIVNRDKKPVWRRVEYEGDSFMLNSFKEEKLQQYLVYSLESELEQCIERARLLRFGCKVYLFAAYPCQQAKIITEDYLFDYYRETQECDQDIDASYHYEKERRSGRLCA